ncbi:MAG: tRNA dihydrouridine synthase DusB [Spirochaetales bacterium]
MSKATSLYHPIHIGGIKIRGNVFLAPMAGYTDVAFRTLAVRQGADCTYTELVSAEGLLRESKSTTSLLSRSIEELFWGIQIFTSSPAAAAQAVEKVQHLYPTFIDLNCGCPVPKVVRTGAGAALLKDPSLIYSIVHAMKEHSLFPITVKIRSGWDGNSINYLETAEAAQMGGASLICLHPRTKAQGYGGISNWEHLARLKQRISLPVFGSGDLFTPVDAKRMLEQTGCDGVMIARGAIGNPFIFQQVKALLTGSPLPAISPVERIDLALQHLELAVATLGEKVACQELRKHFCFYIKGLSGSAIFRRRIVQAETKQEYHQIFMELKKHLLS